MIDWSESLWVDARSVCVRLLNIMIVHVVCVRARTGGGEMVDI